MGVNCYFEMGWSGKASLRRCYFNKYLKVRKLAMKRDEVSYEKL